ncbi:type IV toxin-antitoxin system AbiEi family antitoxin domain-containing protein [Micromonospora sp. NPDC049645]|uniref:type IV toxin-antitoxin system AbiEi family antitoxin domain-containing protein n=1 Tax=Micromonospora sp. NPDC049645 TaxID=3155508 RepID=UPI003418FF01
MGAHQLLRQVAAGQDGMVTLGQALRAGLTRDQVRQLHRSGRWQRVLRGCFVHPPPRVHPPHGPSGDRGLPTKMINRFASRTSPSPTQTS